MEFAPWGGRPVSCVSDNQCAAAEGVGVLFVKCTWLTGLPDGAEDGRYCTCAPFMRGLTCQDPTPVLQLRGFVLVPSVLLTVLALWRALRDLRECPREKRASPGALCLMLGICAASSFALYISCECVTRWTGGNAAMNAIIYPAQLSFLGMAYSELLCCALLFECIIASTEQRTVRQKRWCALSVLFMAAEGTSYSTVPFLWQRMVVAAVGFLVVVLLWVRAARRLANTLEDFSAVSAPIAELARVTREFIQSVFRLAALGIGCFSVLAVLNLGLNDMSPLPVIVSVCLLEAVLWTAFAAALLRFQDYLGMPFRRARACSMPSRVRPCSSTDSPT
jgi:hypothetical protein